MTDRIRIKGGAGPSEAGAIVAVINHIMEVERVTKASRPASNRLPAWVRAVGPGPATDPLDTLKPEHRGEPV